MLETRGLALAAARVAAVLALAHAARRAAPLQHLVLRRARARRRRRRARRQRARRVGLGAPGRRARAARRRRDRPDLPDRDELARARALRTRATICSHDLDAVARDARRPARASSTEGNGERVALPADAGPCDRRLDESAARHLLPRRARRGRARSARSRGGHDPRSPERALAVDPARRREQSRA